MQYVLLEGRMNGKHKCTVLPRLEKLVKGIGDINMTRHFSIENAPAFYKGLTSAS